MSERWIFLLAFLLGAIASYALYTLFRKKEAPPSPVSYKPLKQVEHETYSAILQVLKTELHGVRVQGTWVTTPEEMLAWVIARIEHMRDS